MVRARSATTLIPKKQFKKLQQTLAAIRKSTLRQRNPSTQPPAKTRHFNLTCETLLKKLEGELNGMGCAMHIIRKSRTE